VAEDCQWSTLEDGGTGPSETQDWESIDYSGTGGPTSSDSATEVAGSFRIDTKMDTNVEAEVGTNLLSNRLSAAMGGTGSGQSLVGSVEMDRELMDDLFETRGANKKYKEMLVS